MGVGTDLIRETRRQRERLEPYNEEAVRHALAVAEGARGEAESWAAAQRRPEQSSLFDSLDRTRQQAVDHMAVRSRRAVCAYMVARLRIISNTASALPTLPPNVRQCLSTAEASFVEEYAAAVDEFSSTSWAGAGVLDLGVTARPPQALFIQVRVNADCGVIETEFGRLHLARNTLHFVRRADVQALLDQGLVSAL
jgi:hypothetical protein